MSPERRSIAVIEDDPVMGASLVQRLHLEGYRPVLWDTGGSAVAALERQAPDLVVCDLRLPDIDGEEVFRRIRPCLGSRPFMLMTAYADIDQAIRMVRAGADDYVTKPFDIDALVHRIDELLAVGLPDADGFLGRSGPMQRIEAVLRRVSDIDSTVLITGESGVGKEVAARFLHDISGRADAPFMAVNCSAIPDSLIESEIFGHEKGAFTGAAARHLGYAERARGGVLFLDEVGDLSPAAQVKLLRLVQDRAFHRVGGEKPVPFAARIVCATNVDLQQRVADGRFREDLFYRLNVIPVEIPSLRQRPDDVEPLLLRFVEELARDMDRPVRGVSPPAIELALYHAWPGNVRELRNRVERAVALCDGPRIDVRDLFPEFDSGATASAAGENDATPDSLAEVRDRAEQRHIRAMLAKTGGRLQDAALLLGISRTTLWEKMRRHGLSPESD